MLWCHTLFVTSLAYLLWPDDSMESFDSERRPHFPQFSYSASGTAWPAPSPGRNTPPDCTLRSLPASSADAVGGICHLTICKLRFPRRKKKLSVVILWVCFEDWPQSALTLTLHFLVIILYTEQASIHYNDSGNADMLCTNEATDMNFERGHFYMESTVYQSRISFRKG